MQVAPKLTQTDPNTRWDERWSHRPTHTCLLALALDTFFDESYNILMSKVVTATRTRYIAAAVKCFLMRSLQSAFWTELCRCISWHHDLFLDARVDLSWLDSVHWQIASVDIVIICPCMHMDIYIYMYICNCIVYVQIWMLICTYTI